MRGFLFRPTLSVLTRLYAIFLVSVNARTYEGTNAYEGTSVEPTNVYERKKVRTYERNKVRTYGRRNVRTHITPCSHCAEH